MNQLLHRELWTSWASLIRSYSAAHGLNSTHHAVVEVSDDKIILRHGVRWMTFTPDVIEHEDGTQVSFHLTENGTAVVNRTEEEMDHAAERLAREMMQA